MFGKFFKNFDDYKGEFLSYLKSFIEVKRFVFVVLKGG